MNTMRERLFSASSEGYLEVVRELLARGAEVYLEDTDGCTPLFCDSDNGQLEIVRELLRGDLRWTQRATTATRLWAIARERGHLEVVRELLAHGGGSCKRKRL